MGFPAFEFGFQQGDNDWEFGYFTMDLMFAFFLLPEKANNITNGAALWQVYDLQNLANAFLKGKAMLDNKQSNLFLDGTDAIARMLISGDALLKEKIFAIVKTKSEKFESLAAFEIYYLKHATGLLNHIREFCSRDEKHPDFYKKLFTRGKDNYTYEAWRKQLNIIEK